MPRKKIAEFESIAIAAAWAKVERKVIERAIVSGAEKCGYIWRTR